MSNINQAEKSVSDINQAEGGVSDINQAEGSMSDIIQAEGSVSRINQADGSVSRINQTEGSMSNLNQAEGSMSRINQADGSVSDINQAVGSAVGKPSWKHTSGLQCTLQIMQARAVQHQRYSAQHSTLRLSFLSHHPKTSAVGHPPLSIQPQHGVRGTMYCPMAHRHAPENKA